MNDKPSCMNALGLAHFEKFDYELSIDYFTKAIKQEPTSEFYINRALTYQRDGEQAA